MTATVVTSENLADFNSHRMGLSSAPAPTEAAPKAEPVVVAISEEVPVEEVEKVIEQEEHKPNPKVEKRFSELTKQREDARRDAARERDANDAAQAELKELKAKLNPPVEAKTGGKPTPAQFTDAFEYAEALSEWSAENALSKRDKADAEKLNVVERTKVIDSWNTRQADAKTTFADYEETLANSTVSVSDQVRDAILESDLGPQILYHLAKNPEVATSLATKSVSSALREIGKLEASLSGTKPPAPAKPAQTPSKASPPITPIRATTSIESPIDGNGDFNGSFADWKAARRAGKIK